jgi:hypothetical protein
MRNRNIETAKLACFLNSLRPSLARVVRRKKIERTKRKIGIAAARKAMILKIIVLDPQRKLDCFEVGAVDKAARIPGKDLRAVIIDVELIDDKPVVGRS